MRAPQGFGLDGGGSGASKFFQPPRLRPRHVLAVSAAAGGAALAAPRLVNHLRRNPLTGDQAPALRMPRPVMEALCGAVGEIAQVIFTYPLDTVKVRQGLVNALQYRIGTCFRDPRIWCSCCAANLRHACLRSAILESSKLSSQ